jgi:copper chaperone CopZ
MEAATMTTRILEIDGMTGDDCVNKVRGALKGVRDVSTQNVKVGSATIGADQTGCNAACSAIGAAGFKARETSGKSDPSSTTRPASDAAASNRASHQGAARPQDSACNKPGEAKAGGCCDGGEDSSGNMAWVKPAAAKN